MQFHFAGGFCKCKNVEADLWWFYVVSFVSTHSFAAFLCDFSSALHSESPTGQIIWKRRFWITWRQNCWLEQLRPSEVVGCSAATATAGGRRLEWRLRDSSSSRTRAPSPGFVPSPPQHKIPLSSSWSKNACHQYTHTHTHCVYLCFFDFILCICCQLRGWLKKVQENGHEIVVWLLSPFFGLTKEMFRAGKHQAPCTVPGWEQLASVLPDLNTDQ